MSVVTITKCRHGRCMCHLDGRPWRVKDVTGPGRPHLVSMHATQSEALAGALKYVAEEYA